MMANVRLSQLRKLISEETRKIIVEVGEKDKKEKDDSLDAQIDKYLINYEAESKSAKNEGKDFRMMVRRFLIEADEEEKDKDEDESEEKEKLTAEDLDIESFMTSVMRLIDNYDSLLEVRGTILKRASNFLLEGYEPDVTQSFKDSVFDVYGIKIGKSKEDIKDEEPQAPAADRAGSSPGGA